MNELDQLLTEKRRRGNYFHKIRDSGLVVPDGYKEPVKAKVWDGKGTTISCLLCGKGGGTLLRDINGYRHATGKCPAV